MSSKTKIKKKKEKPENEIIIKTDDPKNIRALATAVIAQACSDYEYILKHGAYGEHKVGQSKKNLESWFMKNDGYFKYLEMSGPAMLNQMQDNFIKYGSVRVPQKKRKGKDKEDEFEEF